MTDLTASRRLLPTLCLATALLSGCGDDHGHDHGDDADHGHAAEPQAMDDDHGHDHGPGSDHGHAADAPATETYYPDAEDAARPAQTPAAATADDTHPHAENDDDHAH